MRSVLNFVAVLFVAGFLAKIEGRVNLPTETIDADDPNIFTNVYENSIEMLENDVARNTIVKFLNDVKEIMDNKIAFEILTGISATAKVIFSHETGHQTVEALSNGVTDILVDGNTSKSIQAGVNGIESVLSLENTLKLAELEHAAFKELVVLPQTPQAISMVGTGLRRLIEQKGINTAIKNSFKNLAGIIKKM